MLLTIKLDDRRHNRKVRKVAIGTLAEQALQDAKISGKPLVRVENGGTVANSYGYRAYTDAVVCVAFPGRDECMIWATETAANKATDSGTLAACLGEWARPFGDNRFKREKQLYTYQAILAYALGNENP